MFEQIRHGSIVAVTARPPLLRVHPATRATRATRVRIPAPGVRGIVLLVVSIVGGGRTSHVFLDFASCHHGECLG